MEIGTIKSHSVRVEITDPATGNGTGLFVTLRPEDDPILKRVLKSGETEGLSFARRGKVPSEVERETFAQRVIIGAIESWQWLKDSDGNEALFHGEKPELNETNVRALINEAAFVREQIEEVYAEKKRFFR